MAKTTLQALILFPLAAIVLGCTLDPDQTQPARLKIAEPGEIEAVEARLLSRSNAWRALKCPRPVLHGEAKSGSGAEATWRLLEKLDLGHPCRTALDEIHHPQHLHDRWDSFFRDGSGFDAEALARITEQCGPIQAEWLEIASHEETCSPWRPGINHLSQHVFNARSALARSQVLTARSNYSPTTAHRSARDTLDWIRLQQDMIRGDDSILQMSSAHDLVWMQGPLLTWLLDSGDLDGRALDEVVRSLGQLMSSEPRAKWQITASFWTNFFQVWQPLGHGPDWVPPGGWADEHQLQDHLSRLLIGWLNSNSPIDHESTVLVALLGAERTLDVLERSCPLTSSGSDCRDSLDVWIDGAWDARSTAQMHGLASIIVFPDTNRFREYIFPSASQMFCARQIQMLSQPAREHTLNPAIRLLRLTQLRLHAAFLQHHVRTDICPTSADLKNREWLSLLQDPITGGTMRVEHDEQSSVVIVSTAADLDLRPRDDPQWKPGYRFKCPPSGSNGYPACRTKPPEPGQLGNFPCDQAGIQD
jgi:hypothetical protein